jgi:hypothetical protein
VSLPLGIAALALVAGGWLIRYAWSEIAWRRDERDAEIRLRCILAAQRAREPAEDATADAFARTLEEIRGLAVASPWDVS